MALSSLNAGLDSPFCYAVGYGYTEQLLAESGCAFSLARASIFTEFFPGLPDPGPGKRRAAAPPPDGRVSFVSRGDVARSLAALATAQQARPRAGDHRPRVPGYMAALAALAQQEWATPVTYTAITPAELVADLAADGEDPWWIYAYSSMFASIRDHRWAAVSADTERLTGVPPTPVRTILARHEPLKPIDVTSIGINPGPSDVVSFP